MAGRALFLAPQGEPVSVDDANAFARIRTTAEDALVEELIVAARKRCEDWRGQSFLTQTWDYFIDTFPRHWDGFTGYVGFTPREDQYWSGFPAYDQQDLPIELPRPPLQTVSFVKYTPYNGAPVTLDPATYVVDNANTLAPRIVPAFGKLW